MKDKIVSYSEAQNEKVIKFLILLFLGLSFLLSDWMIYLFTFSDFFMGLSIILLLLSKNIRLSKKAKLSFLFVEGYLILHILFSYLFLRFFEFDLAMNNLIKVFFYHFYIASIYNYVRHKKIEFDVLKWLNIFALIAVLIGIYIMVAIMLDINLPFEFLWTFTRQDSSSYMFEGNANLIRARSVFSEPAHLGYFLSIILSLNLFQNEFKVPNWINMILIIGIVITFSYSSIAVMMLLLIFKGMLSFDKVKFPDINIKSVVSAFAIMLLLFYFRDTIYETIIVRTQNILAREDGSFLQRIFYSWHFYNHNNIYLGNGLGHTQPLQNIYAYMLSDLGLISLIISILFSLKLVLLNVGLGFTFILLNFQKGGYLSPIFWLLLLVIILFSKKEEL